MPKARWYRDVAGGHDPLGIFAETDNVRHARRRRILAGGFSRTQILKWEPQITDRVNIAIRRIKELGSSAEGVDLCSWFSLMAADTMGFLSCGESFEMLEHGQVCSMKHIYLGY